MYLDEAERQEEIERLSTELENFSKIRVYGPDIIEECKKKMEKDPANMEKYQYRINSIMSILLNFDTITAPKAQQLAALVG